MRKFIRLLLICCALSALPGHAAGTDDLLEPEKAFRFSARAIDAGTVEGSYRIADGYYLYRERFRFATDPGLVKTGVADGKCRGSAHERGSPRASRRGPSAPASAVGRRSGPRRIRRR